MTSKRRNSTVRHSMRIPAVFTAALLGATILAGPGRACDETEELAERRAAVAAKSETAEQVAGRYALALWARDKGLGSDARKEFETVLALDPEHSGAHEALGHQKAGGKWYTHAEAMQAKGLVRKNGAWMLPEQARVLDMPASEKERRRQAHAKIEKLLSQYAGSNRRARKFALEALGTVEDAYKLEPFAYALRSKSADVRLLAAQELGRLKDRRALRPLLHRAIYDPVEEVRFAAIDAAKLAGDENLLAPLVRALTSANHQVVANSAGAIARVGDVRGVKYLVYRYEAHGGGAPRVHYSDVSQLTFIQDFDVEVAQTAFIADPIVGVIQEGNVLDVQVVATQDSGIFIERQAIHGALRTLTLAEDVEDKPGAWAKWYEANKDTLVAAR